jgi:signal transduction histidine kinase
VRIDEHQGELAAIDPSDLTHALTNLVDNALKYTTGAVDVRVEDQAGRVVVRVEDQGPGMSPEEVSHAFDRFFRGTRRDVEGSGLGLAIARRAIERVGGTLSLESDPLTGSCFTISLPAAPQRTYGPPAAPPAPPRYEQLTIQTTP